MCSFAPWSAGRGPGWKERSNEHRGRILKIEPEEAGACIAVFVEGVKAPDAGIRGSAALYARNLSHYTNVRTHPQLPAMIAALAGALEERTVSPFVVEALGGFGPAAKDAVPALSAALKEATDKDLRRYIINAMERIDPTAPERAAATPPARTNQ